MDGNLDDRCVFCPKIEYHRSRSSEGAGGRSAAFYIVPQGLGSVSQRFGRFRKVVSENHQKDVLLCTIMDFRIQFSGITLKEERNTRVADLSPLMVL